LHVSHFPNVLLAPLPPLPPAAPASAACLAAYFDEAAAAGAGA